MTQMTKDFFPDRPSLNPRIYAYEDSNPIYSELLKIGYTNKNVKDRVAEQYPTKRPGDLPYKIVLDESAIRSDGSVFTDHDVHKVLRLRGFLNPDGEWFRCSVSEVKSAVISVSSRTEVSLERVLTYKMRPEQEAAVEKTAAYYRAISKSDASATPRFLWNAKMRFGKTFATYQLARKMGWKRLLVLTFKPAVQSAWRDDLVGHVDFEDWQFISRDGLNFSDASKNKPLVCFGSFQDFMGRNRVGGIKARNEWVHTTNWDCVVLDEYHYGAWRESAKDLFEAEEPAEAQTDMGIGLDVFDQDIMPITTKAYLYLSGTPFRALESGEFIEEQIYNWTYSDEQRAKEEWVGGGNPYASLPRMVLMTYQLPDSIREIVRGGEFNEFDLNTFFSAEGEGDPAEFKYESEVQKWLDLIRGAHLETSLSELKLGAQKPPLPYADRRLLSVLNHTFWFLPSIASCYAMANLLSGRQNTFYSDYRVVIAAGSQAGIGAQALPPVYKAMGDPLRSKTITLSCGKLTTGVSVKPWTGIFMLRNCSSPETYFQAAFRVQTPWVVENPDGISPNSEEVVKRECYVFDFAPDRALQQIANYSCRLDVNEPNAEKKVQDFINFLPVLAYDGSSMKQINAAGILDMAMSGTTATLLARRWQSALLVNVDNDTLQRLLSNESAMNALMKIEGFRSLSVDIQTIINKSERLKKAKKEANERDLTPKERKQLTADEKDFKSKRKMIQEKLIKFATRIPVFMYLTDFREQSLQDVITKIEPGLFKKVTGLTVDDFNLLLNLKLFNSGLMNDAVGKFRRYEEASLEYTGINKHEGEKVGLFNTVIESSELEFFGKS